MIEKRNPTLDGLRGIAIFLVLCAHMPSMFGSSIEEWIINVLAKSELGYIGVDLFFCLSGYLITLGLLKSNFINPKVALLSFYTKRFLRIFPIYYITIFVCFIAWPNYNYTPTLLYLSNYYFAFSLDFHPLRHTWSLAVEEQFYLIWPALLLFAPRHHNIKAVVPIICGIVSAIATILIETSLESSLADPLIYRGLESRMLSLSLGAFAAMNIERIGFLAAKWKQGLFTSFIIVIVWKALELPLNCSLRHFGYSAMSFFFLIGALLAIENSKVDKLYHRILGLGLLRWLGKISYGLYLYHSVILFALKPGLHPKLSPIEAVIFYFGSFAVAAMSYYVIEMPLLRLKDKLSRRIENSGKNAIQQISALDMPLVRQ